MLTKNILTVFLMAAIPLIAIGERHLNASTPYDVEVPQDVEDFNSVIKFEHTGIDLGEMTQESEKQPFAFKFVNEGNAPLVLTYVHASCSCIGIEYPRHPIAPGDSAAIKGYLNPHSISEPTFQRNILIRSNAKPGQTRVFITGKIKK